MTGPTRTNGTNRPRLVRDRGAAVRDDEAFETDFPTRTARLFEEAEPERPLVVRYLNSFPRRNISWLWYPFIPRGMITLIVGDGGVGKSTMTLDIAARMSSGRPLPCFGDDDDEDVIKGKTVIFTKEDMFGNVVRPRLEAAGADLRRICSIGYDNPDAFERFDPVLSLQKLAGQLEQTIDQIGDVKLVIVDPITDFTGDVNLFRENEVRAMLYPLARLAARFNLAMVLILHLNKKTDQPAKYRGLGSVAFRNVARSVLLVGPVPEHPGSSLLMQEKPNLTAKQAGSAMFNLETAPYSQFARVEWERDWQEVGNADDVLNGKKPSRQQNAVKFLRNLLADGPMSASQVYADGREAGFSEITLRRAKANAEVISRKVDREWEWRLE